MGLLSERTRGILFFSFFLLNLCHRGFFEGRIFFVLANDVINKNELHIEKRYRGALL